MLVVVLGLAGLLVVLAVPLVIQDYVRYGVVVLAIAGLLATSAWLTRRAVAEGADNARRLAILTGVLTLVFSPPLISIWVGLLTAVAGVGLLVVVFAPEREQP